MHLDMVPPERPACTGINGWLVTIIGEAVRRVKPRAPLSCSPMPGARRGSVDPHARTPNTQVRVIENTYPSSSSGVGYMASGIDDEVTLRANREGFLKFQLRPRRLNDVSKRIGNMNALRRRLPRPRPRSP